MTKQITHFALLAQPTLIFRTVKAYDAAGFIPSLVGVTLDGKRQTTARVADVAPVDPAERVAKAEHLGRAAFMRGLKAIPAQDPAVMPMLTGLKVGEGLPLLEAWSRGWHAANLAAPVPGWTEEENAALQRARSA